MSSQAAGRSAGLRALRGYWADAGVKVATLTLAAAFVHSLDSLILLLAERMLASGYPLWWQAKFQYDAFVVMMLCCAAVDGTARLTRWASLTRLVSCKLGILWAAAICAGRLRTFRLRRSGPLPAARLHTNICY